MPSTVIEDIVWRNGEMTVTFTTGRVYVYSGVPREVHLGFINASSKGAFFNRQIRDRYRFRELTLNEQ